MAPTVLVYVLGPIIGRSARQVLAISPALLLSRPVFWGFLAFGALGVFLSGRMLKVARE